MHETISPFFFIWEAKKEKKSGGEKEKSKKNFIDEVNCMLEI